MIHVRADEESFHYDIHSLIQAFFPGREVRVRAGEGEADYDYELTMETEDGLRLCFSETEGRKAELFLSPGISRPELKSEIKRLIYKTLSQWQSKTLPWGTLTGIRPTKIAMDLLNRGESPEAVLTRMRDWYLASPEKAALALEIAGRERAFLREAASPGGYSLYVGIPFCPTRCLYCSFASNPLDRKGPDRREAYLEALFRELALTAELFRGRPMDSLYIGGGTPTALTEDQLRRLFAFLEEHFPRPLREYTLEAGRPDSITREKLVAARDHGITRISVNPQTMNDETLKRIGRRHTAAQIEEAFALARELGFTHINMDLILGLPGEGERELEYTLKRIEPLAPENLTVHALAVKRASGLKERLRALQENGEENGENPGEDLLSRDFCRLSVMAQDFAHSMGLLPYYLYRQKNMAGNLENVGYARPDRPGAYNILMMEEVQDIAACGAGTISKRVYPGGRIERGDDVKELSQYLDRIEEMLERKRRLYGHEGQG